ncbi:MAG: glycosyl transferase family 2 [Frankiales bacterium]|nr:glycosyl transferase family 2 [Frankiales bacterium]
MSGDVHGWFDRRTYASAALPDLSTLLDLKGARTVGLIIPALNEAPTIGGIVAAVREHPATRALLDEVLVIDGGSRDATSELAEAAGAQVVQASEIARSFPGGGKGGSVWRAVQVSTSDLLVVVDADLDPFDPQWVVSLVAPLLMDPDLHLVKAASERPLTVDGILHPRSGGRVTELVARPLLNALWPELAGVIQPLSGELAARRELLERLPFATGYGLEIGMLVDTLLAVGIDAIAQVDIGQRRHRHQSDLALGRMSSAVLRTALARSGLPHLPDGLLQFSVDDEGHRQAVTSVVPLEELPSIASLRQVARR